MQNEAPNLPPPDGRAQGGQPQGGQAQGGLRARAWAGRLRALILDNKLFTLVLAAGAVLRLIAVLGYPGALWFAGDSYVYLGATLRLRPDLSKSTGYSLMLKVLEPFHSLTLVTIVQHLMGLAIGVLLYVLLRRARVPKLVSALATVPVLLNGFQIELEHLIMADTLFMFLLVVAATILLWRPRPSWPAVLIAGLLTGYAVTVWSGGLILPVVFIVFVIWRRMGWRPLAAIVAGSAIPIVAYAAWFHSSSGTFALTRSEGFYLYGRVSSFAECSKINPPANERFLCLSIPVTKREPPGDLVWHIPQVKEVPGGPVSVAGNKMLRDFAIRAMEAQPVSYAHAIVDGVVLSVDWKRYNYPSRGTVYDYYFHTVPQVVPVHSWIPGGHRAAGHPGLRPPEHQPGREAARRPDGRLRAGVLPLRAAVRADPHPRAGWPDPGAPAPVAGLRARDRRVPPGAAAGRAEHDAVGGRGRAPGLPDRRSRLRLPVRPPGRPVRLPGRGPRFRPAAVAAAAVRRPGTGRRRGPRARPGRGCSRCRPRVSRRRTGRRAPSE